MKKGILFSRGDSAPRDGSRPVGAARVRELLGRDLSKYFLTGLVSLFATTLYGFGLWLGMAGGSIMLTLLAGLVLGIVAGPCICGLVDTIYRTMRDFPGFDREVYLRAFRQNALQACIAGAIFGLLTSGIVFSLYYGVNVFLCLVSLFILSGVMLYSFSQIVTVSLGFFAILRNSLVLMTAHPLVSLKALVIIAIWSFVLWLLAPLSVLFWAVGGLWLPLFFACHYIYNIMDETFKIEENFTKSPASDPE